MKLFKDHHYSTYIVVTDETDEFYYGIQHMIYYTPMANRWRDVALDARPKVWLKAAHPWEIYDETKVPRPILH